MKFLHYKGHWYDFDMDKFRAYNFRGSWFIPNENEFGDAEIKEYKNWHTLYKAERYDPTMLAGRERFSNDVWISPLGTFHWGEAHAVQAGEIAEIWYGYERNIEDSVITYYESAERILERHGWVKCSRFFWHMHLNEHYNWGMNQKQAEAVKEWCDVQGIEYPEDIIYIREWF